MSNNSLSEIYNFLLDINCLDKIKHWSDKVNVFNVLQCSHHEIRHSNVLAWLFNPQGNHGLRDKFIKMFFQSVIQTQLVPENTALLLKNFDSFEVYREYHNIDILLVSKTLKLAIAIENKIGSTEHDQQLQRYRSFIEAEYHNYKKFYIYLTPDEDIPSDDAWSTMGYKTIENILTKIVNSDNLIPEVKLIITNYIDVLRRYIVETDDKLIDLCKEIYNSHKNALDLIFEYGRSSMADKIHNALMELAADKKIIFNANDKSRSILRFYTPQINKILPNLKEGVGGWNNKHVYAYEIRPESNVLRISCVISCSKDIKKSSVYKTIQQIFNIENKTEANEWKWNSIYKVGKPWTDIDEDDIKSVLESLIDEIYHWENKLVQVINQ